MGPDEPFVVSEKGAVGGVDVNPPALRVDQDDQVGGVLGDHAEAFFGFAQILRHLRGELEGAIARRGQGTKYAEKEQAREQTTSQHPCGPEAVEAPDNCFLRSTVLEFPDSAGEFNWQRENEGARSIDRRLCARTLGQLVTIKQQRLSFGGIGITFVRIPAVV